jgi:hypothetical protein
VNAGESVDSQMDRIDSDSARTFETTVEDTFVFHTNPHNALHTAAVKNNLEDLQWLMEAEIALDCGDLF